jgi:hypothetical protein
MPSPASQVELIADDDRVVDITVVEDQLGELIVIEDRLSELIGLDAPGAQIAIGPSLSDVTPNSLGLPAAGVETLAARADHVHAHGELPGGASHAIATRTTAGFLSPEDFQSLEDSSNQAFANTLVRRDEFGRADFVGIGLNEPLDTASGGTGNFFYQRGDILAASGATNLSRLPAGINNSVLIADSIELLGIRYSKIFDANIDIAAGIQGTKILPDFGSLDIITTGAASFGSTIIDGSLTVNGTLTTVDTETISVTDKVITIGSVEIPSDTTANEGGIVLKGTTDKTILWLASTGCWSFNNCINLLNGSSYKIAGQTVLSPTQLGASVTQSSLTSVGTITSGAWDDGTF